jgi:hypothetical protein
MSKAIFCCGCGCEVPARLTDGAEIYPHLADKPLGKVPFWKCDCCGNYVGTKHKTKNPTEPLGVIPTPELRNARRHIHALMDPMWKSKKIRRSEIYARLSEALGYQYHTAEIRTITDARRVYRMLQQIQQEVTHE